MQRVWMFAVIGAVSCSAASSPPKTCDMECQDGIAARSVREAMKLLYNVALQGNPDGPQDATEPCPLGGSARVSGTATSNATLGVTKVDLTYAFSACAYSEADSDETRTFSVTLDGTATEVGTISVEPSSTTSLTIHSDSLSITGWVFTPTQAYSAAACVVSLGQDGGSLSGKVCDRPAGATL
jgi:hypothetical protein